MKKLITLAKSEAVRYLIFGVLTTLVYYIFMYGSFIILQHTQLDAGSVSEAIGQIVSIIFAFFTNKKWVFEHESKHVFLDFLNFAAGRLIFMVIAILAKWWFIDVHPSILMNLFHLNLHWMVLLLSLFLQVMNILLNYFYSKFIVFRKKKTPAK